MRREDRAKGQLDKIRRLDELAKKDVGSLFIVKRLSDNQKRFLIVWRQGLSVTEMADILGLSRPMVYKLMNDLSSWRVIEHEKEEVEG